MRSAQFALVLLCALAATASAVSVISGNCGSSPLVVTGSGINATINGFDRQQQCETDVQGPNDEPGQKDLNWYCANHGVNGSKLFLWSWDDIAWSGKNTGDACLLLDSNGNGAADLALCVSVHQNGELMDTRFFRCTSDSSTSRCFGSEDLLPPPGGFRSTCCVMSEAPVDPFYDANDSKKTGDFYPLDTLARCEVYMDDFQAPNITFVDVCSYPSLQPNSDPSDCVLTKICIDRNGQPDDSLCQRHESYSCWLDVCDAELGVCRTIAKPAGVLCENPNSTAFCDGKDTCDGAGVCVPGQPLDCSDNTCPTVCQLPQCMEPTAHTEDTDATCGCASAYATTGVFAECTGECGGSAECQRGTCNAGGTCTCENLLGACAAPVDGPCDAQCQNSMCNVGTCRCNNLPDTTLCESDPPNFCDGKQICRGGTCATLPPPTCNGACPTFCEKEVCRNPSVYAADTEATCVCVAAPEREGLACEPDTIVCTLDQCDAFGQCVHPPGPCTGCAIDCLTGICTPEPSADQLPYVWDDGCVYSLEGSNATSLPIQPPPFGTQDPLCGNVDTFAVALNTAVQPVTTSPNTKPNAGSVTLFTIGTVFLCAGMALAIIAYVRHKDRAHHAQEMI